MNRSIALPVLATALLGLACATETPTDPVVPDDSTSSVVASVVVTPDVVQFGARTSTRQLSASVRNASGDELDDPTVTWAMSGSAVARVLQDGRVTSVGDGTDTVTATAGGVIGTAVITVQRVPARVTFGAHPTTLFVIGDTLTIPASVADSNGFSLAGPVTLSWSSSDSGVIGVTPEGTLIATGVGQATVAASGSGFSASETITVSLVGPDGPAMLGATTSCAGGMAGPFPCNGMDLLAYLPKGGFGANAGTFVNDLWGWTDPATGEEWALVGRTDGTAFVNVTDPGNPYYAGVLPLTAGAQASTWRDFKVFGNHVFVVADGAGAHGMQVFDLTQLRGTSGPPRVFAETTVYRTIASAHNIVINETAGVAFAVGSNGGGQTCGSGLHMIDISTPAAPAFAGCFNDLNTGFTAGYTHDAQCVTYSGPDATYTGREICFGLNENMLSIADVTDKTTPVAVSRAAYPSAGYTHQGWLTEDQRYLLVDDELDELFGNVAQSRTIVWDVSDLDDPVVVQEFLGPTSASDHNLYIVGTRAYASNYQAGIRVLDIADPTQPQELSSFDTAPSQPNQPGFNGSWSNYPFFASGIVVVTSWDEGLFVLRVN